MEEFELHHHQQQQPYYSKLLLGSPLEIANVDDSDPQLAAGVSSDPPPAPPAVKKKKKRSLPGTPDPSAEVVALSPRTLLTTNRFVCEICGKGFQRDQNLQLHRRGHNLPWKLRQRGGGGAGTGEPPRKRVYVCPEASCVHHSPSRALGDLTGIKKHFCRKHGEKKWKCERCGKHYAVHSDWKAHAKVCGTREYKCDCGTVFSRRDSFVTHRAFCDALAQENNKLAQPMNMAAVTSALQGQQAHHLVLPSQLDDPVADDDAAAGYGLGADVKSPHLKMFPDVDNTFAAGNRPLLPAVIMAGCMLSSLGARAAPSSSPFLHGCKLGMDAPSDAAMEFPPPGPGSAAIMSATALLQKAAELGATTSTSCYGGVGFPAMGIAGSVVGGGGLDRLPTLGHHLAPYDVVPAALGQTATQLVGFDLGGLLPGQLYGGVGAMTRAIGSLMHGGDQHVGVEDRRRGEGVRVVDYMGVDDDDHGSFDGVGPFGPLLAHGPNPLNSMLLSKCCNVLVPCIGEFE